MTWPIRWLFVTAGLAIGVLQVEAIAEGHSAAASIALVEVVDTNGATTRLSGCVVDKNGTVVTSLRPLKKAKQAQVQLADGKVCHVVGYRAANHACDLVLLAVRDAPLDIKPIELALDRALDGERVTLIGAGMPRSAADGKIAWSITGEEMSAIFTGMANSKAETALGFGPHTQWLCADVAAPLICCGGPMLSSRGKVLGILTYVPIADNQPLVSHAVHAVHLQELLDKAAKGPKSMTALRRPKDEEPAPLDVPPSAAPAVTDFPYFVESGGSLAESIAHLGKLYLTHERLLEQFRQLQTEVDNGRQRLTAEHRRLTTSIGQKEGEIAKVPRSRKIKKESEDDKGKPTTETTYEYTAAEQRQVDLLNEQKAVLEAQRSETESSLRQVTFQLSNLAQYSRIFPFRENRLGGDLIWLADPLRLRPQADCSAAIAAMERLPHADAIAGDLLVCRGILQARLGQFEAAEADFNAAAAKLPPGRLVSIACAKVLAQAWKGDTELALKSLAQARKKSQDALLDMTHAAILFAGGDARGARRLLESCLKKGGQSVECRRSLALLLATAEDDKARDAKSALTYASEACRDSNWTDGYSIAVGSSRVDLQACKLEYSIVSPK